jgi:hypothetical protein
MPSFNFQCACGVRFPKSVSRDIKEMPCPSCGNPAKRLLPSSVSVSYQGNVQGIKPPSTGIAAVDTSVDRVIGEDAQNKWGLIRERQDYKKEVLRKHPGSTGFDLTKGVDGDYTVMTESQKRSRKEAESLHNRSIQPTKE